MRQGEAHNARTELFPQNKKEPDQKADHRQSNMRQKDILPFCVYSVRKKFDNQGGKET